MLKTLWHRFTTARNAAVSLPAAASHAKSAADRLRSAGRIPINIWGDVMLDGSAPQVRHVLTGQDAHESLLNFFYFGEVVTLDEAVSQLRRYELAPARPASVTGRYAELKNASPDPLSQLGDEVLQVFVPTALYFKLIGQRNTELCELGCTLFSAIDKMKICSSLIDANLNMSEIVCAAVDHSDYFLRGALKLHRGDNIVAYHDYSDWKPSTPHPFHLSRFVASYAISSTEQFTEWMQAFSAFHIIDVVNLEPSDFTTSNNGLRQIFFNFPKLVGQLEAAGWSIYANDIAADYNSGRRCAVVKLFGLKRDVENRLDFHQALRAHADLAKLLPMERMTEKSAALALRRAEDSLNSAQWQAFVEYKKHFPIWGWNVGRVSSMAEVERLTAPPKARVNLRIDSGQINYQVRRALGE
jgi:hypothetical protein